MKSYLARLVARATTAPEAPRSSTMAAAVEDPFVTETAAEPAMTPASATPSSAGSPEPVPGTVPVEPTSFPPAQTIESGQLKPSALAVEPTMAEPLEPASEICADFGRRG